RDWPVNAGGEVAAGLVTPCLLEKLVHEKDRFPRSAGFQFDPDHASKEGLVGRGCNQRHNPVKNLFDLQCVELECVGVHADTLAVMANSVNKKISGIG